MNFSLTAPFIITGAALLFILLERRYPYDPGQPVFRSGFWTDLVWYTIFQSYVMALIISAIIRWIDEYSGASHLQLLRHWPLWLQVALFLVTHDFYIYWFHRWQHTSRLLWRIHEAHHSNKEIDWLAGSRSHMIEILINQTIEFLPMALLGAAPEVPLIKGIVDAVWGMFIHANLNVRLGPLEKIINGPSLHRWHHSSEITTGGSNFGTKLAIWDVLFGTLAHNDRRPQGYGLGSSPFPRGYFAQHFFAFRAFPPSIRE